MKLSPGDVAGFLRQPRPGISAVLIFGPDDGLVRERATAITRAVIGTVDDPFRLTLLGADQIRQDPARLADEARSMSLLGGRRVVRIRDAADGLSASVASVLEGPEADALLLFEAGDLPARSSLRKLFEGHARGSPSPVMPTGRASLASWCARRWDGNKSRSPKKP